MGPSGYGLLDVYIYAIRGQWTFKYRAENATSLR